MAHQVSQERDDSIKIWSDPITKDKINDKPELSNMKTLEFIPIEVKTPEHIPLFEDNQRYFPKFISPEHKEGSGYPNSEKIWLSLDPLGQGYPNQENWLNEGYPNSEKFCLSLDPLGQGYPNSENWLNEGYQKNWINEDHYDAYSSDEDGMDFYQLNSYDEYEDEGYDSYS